MYTCVFAHTCIINEYIYREREHRVFEAEDSQEDQVLLQLLGLLLPRRDIAVSHLTVIGKASILSFLPVKPPNGDSNGVSSDAFCRCAACGDLGVLAPRAPPPPPRCRGRPPNGDSRGVDSDAFSAGVWESVSSSLGSSSPAAISREAT